MTADELYAKITERKPKAVRPYKIINECVFLWCKHCDKWKSPSDFTNQRSGDRFFLKRRECVECQVEQFRWYLQRNPEKRKQYKERRKKLLQLQSEKKESI